LSPLQPTTSKDHQDLVRFTPGRTQSPTQIQRLGPQCQRSPKGLLTGGEREKRKTEELSEDDDHETQILKKRFREIDEDREDRDEKSKKQIIVSRPRAAIIPKMVPDCQKPAGVRRRYYERSGELFEKPCSGCTQNERECEKDKKGELASSAR
jgi:hypothetical protein